MSARLELVAWEDKLKELPVYVNGNQYVYTYDNLMHILIDCMPRFIQFLGAYVYVPVCTYIYLVCTFFSVHKKDKKKGKENTHTVRKDVCARNRPKMMAIESIR